MTTRKFNFLRSMGKMGMESEAREVLAIIAPPSLKSVPERREQAPRQSSECPERTQRSPGDYRDLTPELKAVTDKIVRLLRGGMPWADVLLTFENGGILCPASHSPNQAQGWGPCVGAM